MDLNRSELDHYKVIRVLGIGATAKVKSVIDPNHFKYTLQKS